MNNILDTMHQNFEGTTKKDINEAILARTIQSKVDNTTNKKLNRW